MNGETSVTAAQQLSVIFTAVASGMIMGLYYDLFRVLRKIVKCSNGFIAAQDIFFWLTSAVACFYQSIVLNGGYIRISFLFTILLSWLFYFITVGRIIMFMVNIALTALKRLFSMLYRYIINPVGKGFSQFFMLISQKTGKILTHITKNTKMKKKC